MLKIMPYKMGSESAKALAEGLGIKRIRSNGRYRPTQAVTIVNWGCSSCQFSIPKILNKPSSVAVASNKLSTFRQLSRMGIAIPEFTTDRSVASGWGTRVVVRHKLNGHNGEGIELIEPGEALPNAPLYVRYQKKEREFRVHVFKGRVIDITEKRKRSGEEQASPYIRNLDNGWVFCRDNIYDLEHVKMLGIRAVEALSLDFGAVDIIEKRGLAWILEVNTAPGIQGTTLQKYIESFSNLSERYLEPETYRNFYRVKYRNICY